MTTFTDTVKTTLAGIEEINANLTKLQEEAKLARKSAIEPLLEALAAAGTVSLIVVRGYTPGFNDGEPCEHSASVFVNLREAVGDDLLEYGEYGFDFPDELADGLGYSNHVENEALCQKHGLVYEKPSDEIMKAIEDVIFAVAEDENDTNYYVTYQLKDGVFVVSEGEYDCGH